MDGITDSMDVSWSKLWDIVEDREGWCVAVRWVTKSLTQLSDWTTTTIYVDICIFANTHTHTHTHTLPLDAISHTVGVSGSPPRRPLP